MKWDNLTMSQKQALMKIYVNNGVTNLDEIVNHYNRFSEGGSKETVESPNNTVLYSRTPRESVDNVVNTRPVPGLITMTEVPKIGAGVNIPITETINNMIARRSRINTPTNVVSTDSIVTRTPVSYIGMPTRINKFDEGGYTKNKYSIDLPEITITPNSNFIYVKDTPFVDKIQKFKADLMHRAWGIGGFGRDNFMSSEGLFNTETDEYSDVAQHTFLFSRKNQKKAFLKNGYIEGSPKDYGLVSAGVGKRNLPVYQKNKDEESRNNLNVLGNLYDNYSYSDKDLRHSGSSPSAIYNDNIGNLYFKKYDLHDYGLDSNKNAGVRYSLLQPFANLLDFVGNPVVLNSGIVKLEPSEVESLLLHLQETGNTELFNSVKKFYNSVVDNYNKNSYKKMYDSFILNSAFHKLSEKEQDLVSGGEENFEENNPKYAHYFKETKKEVPFEYFIDGKNNYITQDMVRSYGAYEKNKRFL